SKPTISATMKQVGDGTTAKWSEQAALSGSGWPCRWLSSGASVWGAKRKRKTRNTFVCRNQELFYQKRTSRGKSAPVLLDNCLLVDSVVCCAAISSCWLCRFKASLSRQASCVSTPGQR